MAIPCAFHGRSLLLPQHLLHWWCSYFIKKQLSGGSSSVDGATNLIKKRVPGSCICSVYCGFISVAHKYLFHPRAACFLFNLNTIRPEETPETTMIGVFALMILLA